MKQENNLRNQLELLHDVCKKDSFRRKSRGYNRDEEFILKSSNLYADSSSYVVWLKALKKQKSSIYIMNNCIFYARRRDISNSRIKKTTRTGCT